MINIVSRSKTQMLDQVFLITWKVTGQQISMFLEIMAIFCTWKAYLVLAFINEISDYTCVLILTSKSRVNTCYKSIVNINNLSPHHFIPTPQPALPTPTFRSALWMPIKLRAHGYLQASFSCRLELREDRKYRGHFSSINGKLGIDVTRHTMGLCSRKRILPLWSYLYGLSIGMCLQVGKNNFTVGYQKGEHRC